MARFVFLLVGVVLLALGSLTVVRSPAWAPWQLAVLAGEFGHWLALLALTLAASALFWRGPSPALAVVTAGVALIAAGLLLKPAFQAWRMGGRAAGATGAKLRAAAGKGGSVFLGDAVRRAG
jgi:hypothetical protein